MESAGKTAAKKWIQKKGAEKGVATRLIKRGVTFSARVGLQEIGRNKRLRESRFTGGKK